MIVFDEWIESAEEYFEKVMKLFVEESKNNKTED